VTKEWGSLTKINVFYLAESKDRVLNLYEVHALPEYSEMANYLWDYKNEQDENFILTQKISGVLEMFF